MSKNRITKMFLMGLALILTGIVCMLGVMAITDSKLTSFRLGTKYEPAFNIEVYTKTVYNAKESSSLVFKSANQSEVNYNAHYIDSVTNDTILFKTENLKTDNGVVVLTIVNNEAKALQAIINKGAQVEIINANSSAEISVEIGTTNLGLFLFSLQIIEYSPYSISYNLTGAEKLTAPASIENNSIEKEIILRAENVDFTKWTITASNCTYTTEIDNLSTKTRAIIKISNPTANVTLTATAEIDYWDGTSATAPYFYEAEGAGTTEENPYLIRTGAQFNNIRNIGTSGKYFKMMNNIYFNEGNVIDSNGDLIAGTYNEWVPLGMYGTFDGSNYYVSGVYINSSESEKALFGWSYGNISYLGVVNSYIKGGGEYVGGICSAVEKGVIQGCYNLATIIGGFVVGGIIGHIYSVVKDCWNGGKVIGNSYVGGICGIMNTLGNGAAKIYNCYNIGSVSGTYSVGGICGWMYDNADTTNDPIIQNCYNFGTVTLSSGTSTLIGGVVGENGYSSTNIGGTVQDCYYWSAFNSTGVGENNYSGTVTNVVGISANEISTAMATLNANATANGWRQWQILPNGMPSFI